MTHVSDVARKVRTLRSRMGVTQQHLSSASGVSLRTLHRVETMDRVNTSYSPRLDTVDNLAHSFGVDLGTFISTPASRL